MYFWVGWCGLGTQQASRQASQLSWASFSNLPVGKCLWQGAPLSGGLVVRNWRPQVRSPAWPCNGMSVTTAPISPVLPCSHHRPRSSAFERVKRFLRFKCSLSSSRKLANKGGDVYAFGAVLKTIQKVIGFSGNISGCSGVTIYSEPLPVPAEERRELMLLSIMNSPDLAYASSETGEAG